MRHQAGLFILIIGALGCNPSSHGTRVSIRDLHSPNVTIDFTSAFLYSKPTRVASVHVQLGFLEVGQMLGGSCPILGAEASLGGVILAAKTTGGSLQCSGIDDSGPECDKKCLNATWEADVSTWLDTQPAGADLVLSDASGSLGATVVDPVPMAHIDTPTVTEGQQLHVGDSFDFNVSTVPPLDVSTVAIGNPMSSLSPGIIAFLRQQVDAESLLLSAALPPSPGKWNASVTVALPAGYSEVVFTYRNDTLIQNASPNLGYGGATSLDWGRIGVVFSI